MKIEGILVACLTPFDEEYEVDWPSLRQHIRNLRHMEGIAGIVCNAHAAEGPTLTPEEKTECLQLCREEAGRDFPLIACVSSGSTREAVRQAEDARKNGADALLVCPPEVWSWDGRGRPEIAMEFHRAIAEAVGLPIILFQYPESVEAAYSRELLLRLATDIPRVVGIKLTTGTNLMRYEDDVRAIRAANPDIALLPATAVSFLANFVIGADGALTGFANGAGTLLARMYAAVKRGDLPAAQALHDRIYPLARLTYGDPFVDFHPRYKEAAYQTNVINSRRMRPPQFEVPAAEQERIRRALVQAGLLGEATRKA